MEETRDEHGKSLALQFDLFFNSIIKLLDTTIERDYLKKLKIMDELMHRINESENDKKAVKSKLERIQDECSKLHYKLKTSTRLLNEVEIEKEKLVNEKKRLNNYLDQINNVLKKPDAAENIQAHYSNHLDCVKQDEKKILNNTDALLKNISYSVSEDSLYKRKKAKHDSVPIKKFATGNIPNKVFSKPCQVENDNDNCRQIIATTTLTMDLDCVNFKSLNMNLNGVNVKSVTKPHATPSLKSLLTSSSDSDESLSFNKQKKEFSSKIAVDQKNDEAHKFA